MHVSAARSHGRKRPHPLSLLSGALWFLMLCGLVLMPARSMAQQPAKGGTVVWAVHESMPTF
jgi:multidrug efflux pump subunit AcrA (membrane-fusion protein)